MTERFAAWPDEIRFSTAEIEVLVGALEVAVEQTTDDAALRTLRRAQVVIWRKLWPELADQYERPENEEDEYSVKMPTDTLLVREVAERLGLDRVAVYHLLATGVLYGRPDPKGDMRVSKRSVEEYEASRSASA